MGLGDIGLLIKLSNWWARFMSIMNGTYVPEPIVDEFTIQIALLTRGYDCYITGTLDDQTRTALKKFQAANGLEADGLFGPETWAKLKGA